MSLLYLRAICSSFIGWTQFYAIFTSLMVSAILLLGGSASISALTGMDIRAATMLLPVGVIAFVIVGGLRSTFVSDYAHTTIVFVIIWLFVYTASREHFAWIRGWWGLYRIAGFRIE
jgi:Na+/proline symporter